MATVKLLKHFRLICKLNLRHDQQQWESFAQFTTKDPTLSQKLDSISGTVHTFMYSDINCLRFFLLNMIIL